MAKKLGIVVFGAVFVDIKGYPSGTYIPGGRNAGRIEQVHGGVSRNIVEDIANVELRPTFVSLVDNDGIGTEVLEKLRRHKVNTDYMQSLPNGMGTWLAVFDHNGEVQAAISKRPDLSPLLALLDEKGDEIFENADSIVLEIDMDKEIVKKIFRLAEKHGKKVYAVVSNMSIAADRRDFIKKTDCFVCNRQEAGILFMDNYDDKSIDELKQMIAEIVLNVLRDNTSGSIAVEQGKPSKPKSPSSSRGEAKPKKPRAPRPKSFEEIPCPVCGKGHILKGNTGFGCSEYKNGCHTVLPFSDYPADLTPAKLSNLLKKNFKTK